MTLMPWGASSLASSFVSPDAALFEAVYEGDRMPPWKESIDGDVNDLAAAPCPIITFATAWLRRKTVPRLTFITSSQSCSENSTRRSGG